MDTEDTDLNISEMDILVAVREALAQSDATDAANAFHELATRYERSVHAVLAQGDNPEFPADQITD